MNMMVNGTVTKKKDESGPPRSGCGGSIDHSPHHGQAVVATGLMPLLTSLAASLWIILNRGSSHGLFVLGVFVPV